MTLKKNILANYLGAGTTALAPMLALPWYLAALGPKQFGLIGFIVMLQAMLGLLDAGMSQSLLREFTLRLNDTYIERRRAATILLSFEKIYWLLALLALCVMLILADTLSRNWLKLDSLPLETGRLAVYGAAAIFAAQFPGSLYRSALFGAQAQVTLNVIMVVSVLLKHVGGVVIVSIWPSLLAYLEWITAVTLLETLLRAVMAWRSFGVGRAEVTWSKKDICQMLPLVLGMSGATLLGALTIQMDKIILSKMVNVDIFGYYTVAWSVAIGVLQLIYPIMNAALPQIINLHNNPRALRLFSAKLTGIVVLIMIGVSAIFFIFGRWLLGVWLNNSEAVSFIYLPLSVLLAGTTMHAIWNVGYLIWLANGKANKAIFSNALALILSVIFTPILVSQYGLVGAAFGWFIMNVGGMLLSFGWLKCEEGACKVI